MLRLVILGFAVGVLRLQQQSALPDPRMHWNCAAALAVCVVTAVAASRLRRETCPWVGWTATAASIAAAFIAGFLYAALIAGHRMADELPSRWEGENIRIAGIVSGLPAINHSDGSTRFAFDVERVITPDAIVPSRVSLASYAGWRGARAAAAADPPPELHAGERWELTVRLRRPHGNANPHGFDLEAWMLENGLRASGHVRAEGSRRIDAFSGRPIDHVDALRERIRARIFTALEGRPYAGVIVALTIGDQRSVSQDQWQLYNRTGVSHLLSIR